MEGIKILTFVLILCGFHFYTVQCTNCEIVRNVTGKIFSDGKFPTREKCWTIPVPSGHIVYLKFNSLTSNKYCMDGFVNITAQGKGFKFCSPDVDNNKNTLTAYGIVTVIHVVKQTPTSSTFELTYFVNEEKTKVAEAREKAVSWLKQQRTAAWGWRENTPRAVVALSLASAATFNGTVLEEELMAKQNELKTAVALLRPSLTNSELSLFIHALLVTCHNPRHFYGNNLVRRLKDQVEESGNFTHPLAYLALCNANESWPLRATSDLNGILNSSSEYPFVKDLQAMAIMALSCEMNRSRNMDSRISLDTTRLYHSTIQHFIKLQSSDGSFGNVYTTALITQALLSSGQKYWEKWNQNATIEYLMNELNSSSVDFLATYLALPILNDKSLSDIPHVNCSANPRKHGDDPTSDNDHLGPKMRVQYSLYIGGEKDVVHTISFRVPENYTAYDVMELAEAENAKYRFERTKVSGKMYVYKIAKVTNDPEAGKFWLLYVGATNSYEPLTHSTKGPNEITLHDGEHLLLWYKAVAI